MDRRTFLKGLGIFSTAIAIHPKSIVTGCDETVRSVDKYHPLSSLEDDKIMWCRIDTYAADLNNVNDWDKVEQLVDAKLANAKETMMVIFKENYDPNKADS